MPVGFALAQVCHAAGESTPTRVPTGTNAVVLEVLNEDHLIQIAKKLALAGIKHALVREVDPPFTNQFTAIGLEPIADRTEVKKYLSKLKLYGESPKGVKCEETQSSPPCPVSVTAARKE